MAKPKKEFKARLRKMQKHVTAMIDLSATDWQRQMLYRIQGDIDQIQESIEEHFDDPVALPPEGPQDRTAHE